MLYTCTVPQAALKELWGLAPKFGVVTVFLHILEVQIVLNEEKCLTVFYRGMPKQDRKWEGKDKDK